MRSCWSESAAQAAVDHYCCQQVDRDFALRIYSTRLLGQEPTLVRHGGGNTSVKSTLTDIFGEPADALRIKASGYDMASIEAGGFAAVRLDVLRKLRARTALAEREMARMLRASLLDPEGPNPSVEVLLHAFLPQKFVDHTHASAILSLVDQPRGEAICAEVLGERIGFVPYAMPGLPLARIASEIYQKRPDVEGLILQKHGIFTFGEDARESYERMIAFVTHAEEHIAKNRKGAFVAAPLPKALAPIAAAAPILRGACSRKTGDTWRRGILAFRTSPTILNFVNGAELRRYGQAGVVTPDHVLRTKIWPLILPPPQDSLNEFTAATRAAVTAFVTKYESYFARQNARHGNGKKMLDPLPRVALVPGLGLFGIGPSNRDATIAADIAVSAIDTITDAEAIGRFESISEAETFDMEYWSLEQAKLAPVKEHPLLGQIAVITGAGGSIGTATARVFASAGAEVALLDVNEKAAGEAAQSIGGAALALPCDVTDALSVERAFNTIVETFGGVDIVVSNAGAAWQGRIGEVDEQVLRKSFELNFYAHQRVAQCAVRVMRAQGTGGCLLFNISKQAVNPGMNFGPYGLPKAATLFLVRQYALEYGADGIRANAVNADRIRSGLVNDAFIAERARARGISEAEYLTDNLLHCEVTANDVAQAFLHQAIELKTTGNVTTVDGGNIAAALR
jgi:rhamnose utilization protein RhaD (predicted bifunctional aldolase and dehydrogenase)/NAD(P)-dependent dehydrogenase (short-subunit alcohol dehydrogenase family)